MYSNTYKHPNSHQQTKSNHRQVPKKPMFKSREHQLEVELESLFKFDPKSIELKTFPQHKAHASTNLDWHCRLKFEAFYAKCKIPANVFEDMFKLDARI